MNFVKEEFVPEKTKLDGIERTENNIITTINGMDINEFNRLEQEKEENDNKNSLIKRHTQEQDEVNYIILFSVLGLGIGMVFGKLILNNIFIAMGIGAILGFVGGIFFTRYLRNKKKMMERK